MRSELINKIFSVETEAEKIVKEAKDQGKGMVTQARLEGDQALRLASEKAAQVRDKAILKAQEASDKRIKEGESALESQELAGIDLEECSKRLASKMVNLLSTTNLREQAQ